MSEKTWQAEIAARAMRDSDFRKLLLSDPKEALKAVIGVTLPDDVKIHVHENDANTLHIALPIENPADTKDPEAFLEKLRDSIMGAETRGPCTTSVKGGTCW